MKLFRENIDKYFNSKVSDIKQSIDEINENAFMSSDFEALTRDLVQGSTLSKIDIDLSKRESESKMISISKNDLPNDFDVDQGQSHPYLRVDYTYALSKKSESFYLAYEPKHFRPQSRIEASINDDKLIIHHQTLFTNFTLSEDQKNKIKGDMILVQDDIKKSLDYLNSDIEKFNESLSDLITDVIVSRRNDILKKRNQDNDLNDFR